ncbi:hypothetical protein LCGC14_2503620 [marine sediment metagenome]|uniref:Uncharacterized protein n=1 Tax=marine sediment metagenome TaxID=412755 RepID=A0A0F9DUU1_9ZZZZ
MKSIKYAHIVPLGNFRLSDKYNDMHLLLYHWAKESEKYLKYAKQSKVYKMLDNSQYELRQEIDYDDLIRYAERMKCDEIIAPDVMYDFPRTKKLIEDFIPKVPKGMKIQGVVCGSTVGDLDACYDWLCENERIDVIGISKHGCSFDSVDYYNDRQKFMNTILGTYKPIHMLGVNHFDDFLTNISTFPIRSIDGKFLAKVANFNEKIDLNKHINPNRLQSLFDLFKAMKK